jgi:Uma2 family endonuclease
MATTAAILTHADLHRLRSDPRDRRRFELVGGRLIVVAAPPPWHQRFAERIGYQLTTQAERQGIPLKLYPAPTALYLDPAPGGDEVQPDLLVVLPDDPVVTSYEPETGWALVGTPWMVVEIGSRSTRERDLGDKKRAYARAGVGVYLFVDLKDERVVAFGDPVAGEERYRTDGVEYDRSALVPWLTGHLDLRTLPWDEVPPGVYD